MFAVDVSAHTLNPKVVEKITGEQIEDHSEKRDEPVDPRGEERTYASFPEWYIVYSAQEYASFVAAGKRPSQFPYFGAIGQYWDTVGHAKSALGTSVIDSSTQTVLRVIGVSFSVENAVIGLYEKSVGWVFEMLNFFQKTTEDRYTEQVAQEYGAFLLHTPWYEFPYGQKLVDLWTTYGWSSLTPRGIERRLAFTSGYIIKGIYGTVLGWLSKSSLGNAELQTYFETEGISSEDLGTITGVQIQEEWEDGHIRATAPRYRAFTPVVETLAQKGGKLLSIQDHSKIMFTVLVSNTNDCLSDLKVEFSMPFITQDMTRVAITSNVTDLTAAVSRLHACNLSPEHIYDY